MHRNSAPCSGNVPVSGTECYRSAFSQPGTAVQNRVGRSGTAYLWRRSGNADLKNVVYSGWSEGITAYSSLPLHSAPMFDSLPIIVSCPLCTGGRRLIPDMLPCACRAVLQAAVDEVSACIQLFVHVGITATGSPGLMCIVAFQPREALRQMCFEGCIPQHSWCSISKLAVWMGACPLVWLQKAEVIFLKYHRIGVPVVSKAKYPVVSKAQFQGYIQNLLLFFKIKIDSEKPCKFLPFFPPDYMVLSLILLRGWK